MILSIIVISDLLLPSFSPCQRARPFQLPQVPLPGLKSCLKDSLSCLAARRKAWPMTFMAGWPNKPGQILQNRTTWFARQTLEGGSDLKFVKS